MADLVIKGMALPKMICGEPGYVDVRIFSDGIVIMAKPAPPYYGKFEAVPLPEGHGRLGDLDALLESMRESYQKAQEWRDNSSGEIYDRADATVMAFLEFGNRTKNAATIVPAEGGTDNGN